MRRLDSAGVCGERSVQLAGSQRPDQDGSRLARGRDELTVVGNGESRHAACRITGSKHNFFRQQGDHRQRTIVRTGYGVTAVLGQFKSAGLDAWQNLRGWRARIDGIDKHSGRVAGRNAKVTLSIRRNWRPIWGARLIDFARYPQLQQIVDQDSARLPGIPQLPVNRDKRV